MPVLAAVIGLLLIGGILWDAFETIVLPRRISAQLRLSRLFLRITSRTWLVLGRLIHNRRRRDNFLSIYGPAALIWLLATWAVGLIVGFGLLQWAIGSQFNMAKGKPNLGTDLYLSGGTLFSSAPSDVTASSRLARLVYVAEGGIGLGLLALVIGYLPVLYQSFAERETQISMLDEWAGSPPTAGELLLRMGRGKDVDSLDPFLQSWEQWSADLLGSYLSYPVLAFFRSQHENASWLTSLTMVLDVCALVIVGLDEVRPGPAQRTLGMGRHVLVDLSQIFDTRPHSPSIDRLPPGDLQELRKRLAQVGLALREGQEADRKLSELRHLYEPFAASLGDLLLMDLPPWLPTPNALDNWQTSAFDSPDGAHF